MINLFKFNLTSEKRGAKNTNNLISFTSFRRVNCNGFNLKDDFMKSLWKNLSLVSMGLLIYSCNEKVSPELQSGNSTTVPTISIPEEYYFKVTNNSAAVLNYKLHRTGEGNASVDCKVKTTGTALSSALYIGENALAHDLKTYDISCYLEAEELSMFYNGLSFKVEASKNTCEYVAYSPYSYYDSIPGSSSAHYVGITCDTAGGVSNASITLANSPTYVDSFGATQTVLSAGGVLLKCGYMVDTNVLEASRVQRPIPEDKQKLCAYDYATNGGGNAQNCDTGIITFETYNYYDADETAAVNIQSTYVDTPEKKCGGSIAACVQGPIRKVSLLNGLTRGSEIWSTTLNTKYSATYELPGLIGKRYAMHDIVNYRRGLASPDLNYLDYTYLTAGTRWADTIYNKSFDPKLMENYAANKYPDGTEIIDAPAILAKSQSLGWTQTPFAADPYLGTAGRVNPFYTFYCLDRGMEIKARIRMVVRDWDRVFPSTSTNLELVSDVYMGATARQDLPTEEEENTGDPGNYNYFNDKDDWDVLVWMQRTDPNLTGTYDPGNTTWSPWTPGTGSVLAWWSPSIFPNQGPVQ
jgi:hypothetical protein